MSDNLNLELPIENGNFCMKEKGIILKKYENFDDDERNGGGGEWQKKKKKEEESKEGVQKQGKCDWK